MDWNELQLQWQENISELRPSRPNAAEKVRRQVKRRDFLETTIAILMLPIFSLVAVSYAKTGNWPAVGFALLIVVAMIGIPLQLWRVRRMAPPADHQLSTLDFLRAEHCALLAQAAQLRLAWLWYFLPIGLGVTGMQFATLGFTRSTLIYAGVVFVMGIVIDVLNRLYAAPKFQRMADAIDEQINELEEDS